MKWNNYADKFRDMEERKVGVKTSAEMLLSKIIEVIEGLPKSPVACGGFAKPYDAQGVREFYKPLFIKVNLKKLIEAEAELLEAVGNHYNYLEEDDCNEVQILINKAAIHTAYKNYQRICESIRKDK